MAGKKTHYLLSPPRTRIHPTIADSGDRDRDLCLLHSSGSKKSEKMGCPMRFLPLLLILVHVLVFYLWRRKGASVLKSAGAPDGKPPQESFVTQEQSACPFAGLLGLRSASDKAGSDCD